MEEVDCVPFSWLLAEMFLEFVIHCMTRYEQGTPCLTLDLPQL